MKFAKFNISIIFNNFESIQDLIITERILGFNTQAKKSSICAHTAVSPFFPSLCWIAIVYGTQKHTIVSPLNDNNRLI